MEELSFVLYCTSIIKWHDGGWWQPFLPGISALLSYRMRMRCLSVASLLSRVDFSNCSLILNVREVWCDAQHRKCCWYAQPVVLSSVLMPSTDIWSCYRKQRWVRPAKRRRQENLQSWCFVLHFTFTWLTSKFAGCPIIAIFLRDLTYIYISILIYGTFIS